MGNTLRRLVGRCTLLVFVDDATSALRAARGKRVHIEEREDGSLSFWHGGRELLATAFPREHGVRPADVVGSKHLAATMEYIKARQRECADAEAAKPSTTLREARLLRAGTPRRTGSGPPAEAHP
jgi:hypothetical protein